MSEQQMIERLTPTMFMPHPALDLHWRDPDLDVAWALHDKGIVSVAPRGNFIREDATDFVIRLVPQP